MVLEFCKCSLTAPDQCPSTGTGLDYSRLFRQFPLYRVKHCCFWESYFFTVRTCRWELLVLSSQWVFWSCLLHENIGFKPVQKNSLSQMLLHLIPSIFQDHRFQGKVQKVANRIKKYNKQLLGIFCHVFWLWILMDFYFSSNTVFLWPLLNVDVLITHTNTQLSFGSYWIPAGHQPWLIIPWVTAEHAQTLGVRAAWPSASARQCSMHSLERLFHSNPSHHSPHAIVPLSGIIIAFSGQEQQPAMCLDLLCPASFPLPRFVPGKLQVELMQSQNLSQDLGKWGIGLKLLFKHDQTVLEDCSGKSINLY